MANYLGYGLKAAVSGFQTGFNMAQQKQEMEWKKAQMKKLEEKEKKISEGAALYSNLVKQVYADNVASEDELMKLNTAFLAAGYEVQAVIKDTHNAIQSMNKNQVEQDFALLELYAGMTDGFDPRDTQGAFDTIKASVKSEKGTNMFDAYSSLEKKRYEIAEEEKPWERVGKVPSEYKVPYLEQQGIDIPEAEVAPEAPTASDAKLNFAISSYNAGKISFDELSKYMGTYIAPEKMSAKREEIELAKQYGATDEEIKNKLLGTSVDKTLTPTPSSVENIREDIKNAPTLEDAKRMEKNHIEKYGDTTGIPNVDKFWSDERVRRLTSIKQGIDKLLDEKKRLKKGTITSADVGFEIEDDVQKVEAVYQQLREEYMKYRKMLEKMGVDVSQYPELMSYEEYIKTDIKPKIIYDPRTWGGQKPAIY